MTGSERFSCARKITGDEERAKGKQEKNLLDEKFPKRSLENNAPLKLAEGLDTLQIPPDRLLPTKMDTQPASDQDCFQLVSTGESAHIADVPIGSGCF